MDGKKTITTARSSLAKPMGMKGIAQGTAIVLVGQYNLSLRTSMKLFQQYYDEQQYKTTIRKGPKW